MALGEKHTQLNCYGHQLPIWCTCTCQGYSVAWCAISRDWDNLTVVKGKCYRKHILIMAHKPTCGSPSWKVPDPQLTIPGAWQCKHWVWWKHNILDKMRVASEAAERLSEHRWVALSFFDQSISWQGRRVKIPKWEQTYHTTRRWFSPNLHSNHPHHVGVASERATQDKCFSHYSLRGRVPIERAGQEWGKRLGDATIRICVRSSWSGGWSQRLGWLVNWILVHAISDLDYFLIREELLSPDARCQMRNGEGEKQKSREEYMVE
jgi:hypothetical protein